MYQTETIDLKINFEEGIKKATALIESGEVIAFRRKRYMGWGQMRFQKVRLKKYLRPRAGRVTTRLSFMWRPSRRRKRWERLMMKPDG